MLVLDVANKLPNLFVTSTFEHLFYWQIGEFLIEKKKFSAIKKLNGTNCELSRFTHMCTNVKFFRIFLLLNNQNFQMLKLQVIIIIIISLKISSFSWLQPRSKGENCCVNSLLFDKNRSFIWWSFEYVMSCCI